MSNVEVIGDDETQETVDQSNMLGAHTYFATTVYTIMKPEFLKTVSEVSEESLAKSREEREMHEIYPVVMSDNLYDDPRMQDFCSYVGHTAWNILDGEGYDMAKYNLRFSEMWTQEHHKHSLMENHVHGFGSQLSGFYFLETPENCSDVVIHDPRPGKVQINLPPKNRKDVFPATPSVHFIPVPGLLMFAGSWLPHSFGRHGSDKPLKFVHFNLFPVWNENAVCETPQQIPPEVVEEIIKAESKPKSNKKAKKSSKKK